MASESPPSSPQEKMASLKEVPLDDDDRGREESAGHDKVVNGKGAAAKADRTRSLTRSPTPEKKRERQRAHSRSRSPTPVKHRERSRSKSPRSPVRRRSYSPRRRSHSPPRRERERRKSRSPPRRYTSSRREASPPRRRSPRRGRSPLRNRYNGVGKPGNNLFIAGFNFITNERDLERKFGKYGKVQDARIVRDARNGESRGFGFVTLDRDEDADDAIRALDQTEWNGRIILVEKAKTPIR
eukprot:TRINITY_DN3707_c0_g2_i1.p1 TRINITY_DN3707_c0_g2~~TRINITY_DN3707_c0_g2_i1.p1  ORF type:complete len:241 (+),score=37.90 TRINITY_DN3707_c0_g2_i1:77-799(+)